MGRGFGIDGSSPRRYFTVKDKVQICEDVLIMVESGCTQSEASDHYKIDCGTLSRWISKLPVMRQQVEDEKENHIPRKLTMHKGRTSQLAHLSEDLLFYVEEYREMGFPLSKKMLIFQAKRLSAADSPFLLLSRHAQEQAISRWMAAHNLTIRVGTHKAQDHPEATKSLALDYILNVARPAVNLTQPHRDRRFIMNMDQTPVFFSMHATRTVEVIGKRSVNIRVAKNGSQRCTVAVCITANGNQLPSLIIFKGKEREEGGKILNQELTTYPTGAFYGTNLTAWMSEKMMLYWVEKVVKPYVATAPPGIVPLLFLDSFSVHGMASVNNALNDIGVEVIIIAPGCTGITQPVDVGYNKPFKGHVRDLYEEWMMTPGRDLTKPPQRKDVAEWIVASEEKMTSKVMKNAWMRDGFEYFPPVAAPAPIVRPVLADAAADGLMKAI